MARLKIILLLYFLFLCTLPTVWSSFDWHDLMGRMEKLKIIWLSEDLFKDSLLKLRQILDVRKEHEAFTSYSIGIIIGRIREKYRFMVEIYREIVDKKNTRSEIYPPAFDGILRPVHFIIALEMMHYLFVEIDKLIHVLEETAMDDLKTDSFLIGRPIPVAPRTGPERDEIEEKAKELAHKSILRQEYLMKKIGQPANMTTTMKRFLRQWPVEDTWSLDKYNYD